MRDTSIRERRCEVASAALRCSPPSAMLLTSPPAQKARPAPVRTITRTAGSPASRGNPRSNPSMIGVDSAFIRSGRLKVSVATPSSMVSISSGMMSRPFLSVCLVLRRQQGLEAAADDLLRASHDPVDQLLAGRNVMDEPDHHAAAPRGRIHDALLQHAAVLRSGNEMANILDRHGGALLALYGKDLFDRRIGQYALGIAQRPHDQPRLQFVCRDQRSLDVVVRRSLLGGDEPRPHVDAVGAEGESSDQTARIGHAAGRHKRDLELLGHTRQQDHVWYVILARVPAAFEAVDADRIAADPLRRQRMANRGAFMDDYDS